uniref:Lipase (inferred by orthology to a zebrafish protein) n=1 Tax=Strongyloides venezuelensis TaxID=75913 RepID=A0A0K0F068_STRVS
MFAFIILIALQYYALAEDPAVKMTLENLVVFSKGQNIEVTTVDGYKLNINRIPLGTNLPKNQTRPAVFPQHELLSSSADWVSNLPYQTAGFMFADASFDVFMENVRGNTYSTGHISLNRTVRHLKGLLYELSKHLNHQEMLLNIILGGTNFMSNKWIEDEISRTFCTLPIFRDVCKDIFISFTGKISEQLNISRFDIFLGHFPADTSLKNMNYWIQMVNSNKQQIYDYGSRYLNMKYYGQSRPPI